ncbi:MAG: amino acid adenylation domain-containing protein, partial [bacterium]|nr:amino acid adenylation domain-containing protein [bacterium]
RLDLVAIEASFQEIVRRHEVLRTTFRVEDGEPLQVISPRLRLPLPGVDLAGLPAAVGERESRRLAAEEAVRLFHLIAGPLIRLTLLRLGEEDHVLLVTMHHIVSDGSSMGIVIRELTALYRALVDGEPVHSDASGFGLPELPVQYADFAHWQRQWLRGEVLETLLAYWRRQLAGPPPVLELPCDRPRPPAMRTSHGAQVPFEVPAALLEALKARSKERGSTLFMTLLAAFMALLHRYTGQRDLAVGSPIAGRNRAEIEALVGFFVNTLVLRGDLSADPSFAELLGRVREVALGAYAHQDLPFEKLVEELEPERDQSRPPLVQVLLALQDAAPEDVELPELVLSHLETDRRSAMFDLTVMLRQEPQRLAGYVEYAVDLFDRTSIVRLARHWRVLLRALAARPQQRISTLPLMAPAERWQLLGEWNDTAWSRSERAPRAAGSIHALFEAQAASAPDRVALVGGGSGQAEQWVSYRELEARSSALARHLLSLGVGPEVLVGVMSERCPEMVTALLAILKAGAAYLPLDPSYPQERLAFVLADARVRLLLIREHLRARLPANHAVLVDLDLARRPPAVSGGRSPAVSADNLAYLLYTSGTTGRPKGVAVPHRTVVNFLESMRREPGLDRGDRLLAVTTLSFDIAVLELFLPLIVGARVVLASREQAADGVELLALLARHGITVLQGTPATWRLLVECGWQDGERPLKVLCGGEALARELAGRLLERSPIVWNLYGPTETTVWSAIHRVVNLGAATVPIGRPIDATRIHLLDPRLRPVPPGVPGELHIGGAGVVRGYFGRPELTAARFIPDPLSSEGLGPQPRSPGARLYKTGDLAGYRSDGTIDFLGRCDHQVKLRGFRIELEEIAAVLVEHPAVRQAVAVVRQECLVAYAAAEDEELPAHDELRRFLGKRLPEYMVPTLFVELGALPLGPTGKVDRRALPAPDRRRTQGEETFVPPQTPLEKLIAGIWSEVLAVDRVGRHDDFFKLGGHSLLATKVFSRLNHTLATELPLTLLFNAPRLGELAARVDERLGERDGGPEPFDASEIRSRDRSEPLPLSFSQERLWLLDRLEPGSTAYNLAFPARLEGELEATVLEGCLNEVARRHESLRTTFAARDGLPMQVIHPPARFRLPVVDLARLAESDRETRIMAVIRADASTPFDLERGPLWRACLLHLDRRQHVLVQNMHHIISDGWSMVVIFRELATLVEACSAGRPAAGTVLPELPIQYGDFALWQRERLRGERLESQLRYWHRQLGGEVPVLELPCDRLRPPVQTHRGAGVERRLPARLNGELHALSRRHDASLFMTLLAAFKLLLYRWTGQEELTVGSPIAGRERIEIEGLVGFFLNTLALRTRIAGTLSFGELLGRVRRVVLEATVHQEVPFEKLLEELQPERSLSHSPLFQVLFNMLNLPDRGFAVPGLKLEALALPEWESKFDFTLYVEEVDDEIRLQLIYNADLFDRARMVEMLAQYAGLLEQIVADPESAIGSYSLVSAGAEKLLPRPAEPLSGRFEGTVHGVFARQAAHFPDQVAVVDPVESWSYGELDRRANQLARYLLTRGVEPHAVVAVYAHRSASLVWALLGILKAGAAFVILDPAYPAARLCEYVRRARPRGWLETDGAGEPPAELRALVAELGCTKLRLPRRSVATAEGFLADQPASDPAVPIAADDLAYVAVTSGSTGRPKGILGRHGAMTHFLPWLAETFRLNRRDRHSLLSALSHDPLHRDVFMPLCYGATLCIPDPEEIGTPGYLAGWVGRHQLTILNLVPAMLQLLCQRSPGQPPPAALDSLRYVFMVGDVLTHREVAALYELSPAVRCVNYYGSTETQRALSYFVVPRRAVTASAQAFEKAVLPVGKGIRDVELLVLNPAGGLAGVGELGEIHVRSHHLALGYLGDEALTRERFVPNPFADDPGDRLYRTGDLGRYLPDGNVEFAGRVDHQVQIRGYRIELGEIEAVLAAHPGVRECAVALRDQGGDRTLVAYAVAATAERPAAGELREHLSARLPDYMVPSAFVFLDALPRTPTGKLDRAALGRRALPEPEGPAADFAAPRGGVEEIVATIWGELLGRRQVGIHDDFFDLGGHSLLATQALSRLRDACGVELSVRKIFEAPTVAGLAAEVIRAGQQAAGVAASRIRPAARDEEAGIPLSFAQERLWFIDRLVPENPAYNLFGSYRLRGSVDLRALRRTFGEIMRRHETLRTTFRAEGEEPRQVIARPRPAALPLVDLGALPAARREQEIRRQSAAEGRRPFDLLRGPLLRTVLMRLAPSEHLLFMNVHHIISDGWSSGILLRELVSLYEAFAAGEPSPLPELGIQYADFALWQRRWLRGEMLQGQLDYWQRQLAGAPELLDLPCDHPRPAIDTAAARTATLRIPASLVGQLRALGRRRGATASMLLLAAWKTLLYRYSGQGDVLVGMAVANRNRSEIEDLIGFFVNTLVLRSELSDRLSFSALLGRVRETALEAYVHQDLPFEKLVEELRLERRLDRNPLCQVMFAYQNFPRPRVEVPGLVISALGNVLQDTGTSKFDLSLLFSELGEELAGLLEYSSGLFDATTIRRLLGHFRNLAEAVVADPEQRLSELSLLSAAEQCQLLGEWNETAAPLPAAATIPELFAAQRRRTPDALAVVAGARQLSYAELSRRADRLARRLRDLGVGPEVAVAICAERSPELVVGVLAILKAGGAYLPIDPDYPEQRRAFMVRDAGVAVVLTRERWRQEFDEVICLDGDAHAEGGESAPASALRPENLAYVIYTSGSTGLPKGTELTHRGLVNLVAWHQRLYGVTAADRATQLAAPGFDAAVWELWPYLTAGAAIHIPEREIVADPARLPEWLVREGISLSFLPTPLAEAVLARPLPAGLRLRALLTGGDRLHRHPSRDLPFALVNHYGPTENTVVTTAGTVAAAADAGAPPIGRPIANHRVYLLDRALGPVPIGVAGELHAAGPGLARGYLGRPRLTAEKFIPNPLAEPGAGTRGERLYKTGDLARTLPDGGIDFLGRIDHQVKIRGFRIELGEIETALGRHPAVREAAVVARAEAGDRRLVAYVVPVEAAALAASELRSWLGESMPEYMVPATVVVLEALPLTAHGKVDRRALPAPESDRALTGAWVGPRSPVEEILAEIWSRVLGVDHVGVHDNFFALGGHSLLATQVASRVRRELEVELELRILFEQPTVAGLADEVTAARRRAEGLEAPPIRPAARRGPLPLSFAQQRLWILDRLEPGSSLYNIPSVLRLQGRLDIAALTLALAEIGRRHEVLRTRFETVDGDPVQVVEPVPEPALSLLDLSGPHTPRRRAEARRLAVAEARRPFDLARGPLVRIALVRLGAQEHALQVTVHHVAFDGWSGSVFLRELSVLYQALAAGRAARLPELPVQYADFAIWQRRWLRGEVLERQLAYWREQLAGLPVLDLPCDRPRPAVQSFRGDSQSFRLPAELHQDLHKLSQEHGTTLFMTLLAAFQALLGRITGEADLAVGTAIANRNHAEIEDLVGFFVNTLVLRVDLGGGSTFRELLGRVRETALGAFAHQDVPFELLVEEIDPQRDLSHNPLFQVFFVLQNMPAVNLELAPELEVEVEGVATGVAKFDLTLSMAEGEAGLSGGLEYNTDLFDATTIRRMAKQLGTLLEGAVADPERRLGELPLLTPAERHELVCEWRSIPASEIGAGRLIEHFEAAAARRPEAIAAVSPAGYLSYGELNARA